MQLMRELSANADWREAIALASDVGEFYVDTNPVVSQIPLGERSTVIPSLSIDDRSKLAERWDNFERLDQASKENLRKTAAAVELQPDSEMLLKTMHAFALWQETLPAKIRDQIASTDPQTRAEAISTAIGLTLQQVTRRSGTLLDDDAIERLYFVLKRILRQRIDAMTPDDRQKHLDFRRNFDNDVIAERFAIGFMLTSDNSSRWGSRRGRDTGSTDRALRRPFTADEMTMLKVILPQRSIDDLDRISGGDSLLELATLTAWSEEAVRRKAFEERGGVPTLLERYEEYDTEYRKRLDLMPPDEIIDRLVPEESRSPFSGWRTPTSSR